MEGEMVDPGFPAHTATATAAPQPRPAGNIRFDPTYINFRNIPGMLKIAQIVFNLIGYICAAVSTFNSYSHANWFSFVSMTGFWVTGILLVLYMMHVLERFYMVPWLMLEFGYCALWCFFYLTAAVACATWGGVDSGAAAASFFGFVAMILYGADAFFKFKAWRSGDIAQGGQQVQMADPGMPSPGAY
ncbi:plasmolipin-like [Homarus americanus]|uniref:plasmolipin-like n=1 Tax=Homarus americanus TaxID=6706 RepID=UPI001C460D0C|nr:plasmolipin-like [Homarus americanus]